VELASRQNTRYPTPPEPWSCDGNGWNTNNNVVLARHFSFKKGQGGPKGAGRAALLNMLS